MAPRALSTKSTFSVRAPEAPWDPAYGGACPPGPPLSPQLTLFQPHPPPQCRSRGLNTFPPQSLCTCCSPESLPPLSSLHQPLIALSGFLLFAKTVRFTDMLLSPLFIIHLVHEIAVHSLRAGAPTVLGCSRCSINTS